jgi:fructose-bisphosphate aldolase class I
MAMSDFQMQMTKMATGRGFIAALDQSGGSTPKALADYGVGADAYATEAEMYDVVHAMRARIISNPAFDGDRILGAILFEATIARMVGGMPTARYLWQRKRIVPFLKIDRGLEVERNGVQRMREIQALDPLLERVKEAGLFGTKMRSLISRANAAGISEVAAQQFEIAKRINDAGLIPIIEPEVNIHAPDKAEAEAMLRDELIAHLAALQPGERVIFKVTLPEEPGFYEVCRQHPNVLRVVALSGGYRREVANGMLAKNPGIVASFSRALAEGLSAHQSDEDFTATLDRSIGEIHEASIT